MKGGRRGTGQARISHRPAEWIAAGPPSPRADWHWARRSAGARARRRAIPAPGSRSCDHGAEELLSSCSSQREGRGEADRPPRGERKGRKRKEAAVLPPRPTHAAASGILVACYGALRTSGPAPAFRPPGRQAPRRRCGRGGGVANRVCRFHTGARGRASAAAIPATPSTTELGRFCRAGPGIEVGRAGLPGYRPRRPFR